MNGFVQHSEKPPPSDLQNSPEQDHYAPSIVPNGELNQSNDAQPLSDLERRGSDVTSPPPVAATAPPSRSYHPLSWHTVSLLAFPSVLGVLARLGLHSLATYDGNSVFALAWVQGMGCFIMGLAVGKRDAITE
jgi:CrcB protein